jgi:hypothetical protein
MQLFGVCAHGYKMAGKLLYLHELMNEVSEMCIYFSYPVRNQFELPHVLRSRIAFYISISTVSKTHIVCVSEMCPEMQMVRN